MIKVLKKCHSTPDENRNGQNLKMAIFHVPNAVVDEGYRKMVGR